MYMGVYDIPGLAEGDLADFPRDPCFFWGGTLSKSKYMAICTTTPMAGDPIVVLFFFPGCLTI